MNKDKFKSGFIAVVGRPNVGKSTLLNAFLEFKLCITTPKPQTTRHRILGILTDDDAQMIFWDTPGLIDPRYKLQSTMMKAAERAIGDADVVLIMTEAHTNNTQKDENVMKKIQELQKPIVLAINKMDLIPQNNVLPMIQRFRKFGEPEIVPISALKEINLETLKVVLKKGLPYGPPLYPPDQLTEHPERFFVSEIIREKIFNSYYEEIPYSTAVVIDEFREREGRKDFIKARIIVERKSQKSILIGKNGKTLKQIGTLARKDIENFLQRPVFLELWVVVREKWRRNDTFLKEFGYENRNT
jgi:GTP-binding protein Era